ncbi:hypothetical protein BJY52DRAFT_1215994, partial [Lactarius psammicola]
PVVPDLDAQIFFSRLDRVIRIIAAPFILPSCTLQSHLASPILLSQEVTVYAANLNRRAGARHEPTPQTLATPSQCPSRATTEKLSDKVLLNIFSYFLDVSPRHWPTLVHICRKWRHI